MRVPGWERNETPPFLLSPPSFFHRPHELRAWNRLRNLCHVLKFTALPCRWKWKSCKCPWTNIKSTQNFDSTRCDEHPNVFVRCHCLISSNSILQKLSPWARLEWLCEAKTVEKVGFHLCVYMLTQLTYQTKKISNLTHVNDTVCTFIDLFVAWSIVMIKYHGL